MGESCQFPTLTEFLFLLLSLFSALHVLVSIHCSVAAQVPVDFSGASGLDSDQRAVLASLPIPSLISVAEHTLTCSSALHLLHLLLETENAGQPAHSPIPFSIPRCLGEQQGGRNVISSSLAACSAASELLSSTLVSPSKGFIIYFFLITKLAS